MGMKWPYLILFVVMAAVAMALAWLGVVLPPEIADL
jgi:hypothetical protein